MSIDALLLPFDFSFMRNAFWIALCVAPPTALLSCFLVLKGWALMGDGTSHATLPGVVLAWLLGAPLIVGAFVAGMACVLATGYLSQNSRVKQDTVLGVVFSGMFAVGIVMYTWVHTNEHLSHVLFGDMLGIGPKDLITSGVIGAVVSAVLILKWKDFLLHAFDPAQAKAAGLNVSMLHYTLLVCLSLTIVATLTSVGLILAVALLITPGAIAYLTTRRFSHMLMVAVGVCLLSMLGGAYASFFIDSATAPTVVLMLSLGFVVAFIYRLNVNRRNSRRKAEHEVAASTSPLPAEREAKKPPRITA